MKPSSKRWLSRIVRWGVAVAGVVWVLYNIPLRDRVRLFEGGQLREVPVWNDATDQNATFSVGADQRTVGRDQLWTLPDRKSVDLPNPGGKPRAAKLLAVQPVIGDPARAPARLLIEDPDTKQPRAVAPAEVVPSKDPMHVNFPLVERGVGRMVREADWAYLAAGILLLPLSYLITSYRWHVLLEAQQIHIGMARTFVINMVGAFYNSFMPGSTGGDLAKAYYAAKHTTHRTRAVLTVIVDRVMGLLALLVLGGAMAAAQMQIPECRKVAVIAGAVIA
ncbi:MAG TPA: lysylphosphatidylglycerol synthase transmembrane domain-containing protein, partial [Humisphaera sp.]